MIDNATVTKYTSNYNIIEATQIISEFGFPLGPPANWHLPKSTLPDGIQTHPIG